MLNLYLVLLVSHSHIVISSSYKVCVRLCKGVLISTVSRVLRVIYLHARLESPMTCEALKLLFSFSTLCGNHHNNQLVIMAILKYQLLMSQRAVTIFSQAVTSLFSQVPAETMIHLVWALVQYKRGPDSCARARALEACTIAPLAGLHHVQLAAWQKDVTTCDNI